MGKLTTIASHGVVASCSAIVLALLLAVLSVYPLSVLAQPLAPGATSRPTPVDPFGRAPAWHPDTPLPTNQGRGIKLEDAGNYEACVRLETKIGLSGCGHMCPLGDLTRLGVRFDYYEPVAIVESVPKPWVSYMAETQNVITRHFTEFKSGPFGGDEAVRTIRTLQGNYPRSYFEAHVWGMPLPQRLLMWLTAATGGVLDERTIAMTNAMTYEVVSVAIKAAGLESTWDLAALVQKLKDFLMNMAVPGSAAAKKVYDFIKGVYDFYNGIKDAVEGEIKRVTDDMKEGFKDATRPLSEGFQKMGEKTSEFFKNITKPIKEALDKVNDAVQGLVEVLQLNKVVEGFFGVIKGITSSVGRMFNELTADLTQNSQTLATASQSTSNPEFLCDAQQRVNQADQAPVAAGGPPAPASAASSTIAGRIQQLGGRCQNGNPVGAWGNRNSPVPNVANQAITQIDSAVATVNRLQDILRSGALTNAVASAAAALFPLGLTPAYLSEFDRPSWSVGTPGLTSTINALIGSFPGFCLVGEVARVIGLEALSEMQKRNFCIGVWGPLYPKVGSVPIGEPELAAAITNYRAFTLAQAWGSLPVTYDMKKAGAPEFNVDHPRQSGCYPIGTIDPRWRAQYSPKEAPALQAMQGQVASVAQDITAATAAAATAMQAMNQINDGAAKDGYVHTYWKKARTCVAFCGDGVKAKKVY